MNSTKEDGTYGTARKNATATAYKWRTKLTEFQLEDINNKCKTVPGYIRIWFIGCKVCCGTNNVIGDTDLNTWRRFHPMGLNDLC